MPTRKGSRRSCFVVFGLLVLLTYLTVQVAMVDLGRWNVVVALTIAAIQALLAALVLMDLRNSPRLTWLVVSSGIVWLAILIGFTVVDSLSRGGSVLPSS